MEPTADSTRYPHLTTTTKILSSTPPANAATPSEVPEANGKTEASAETTPKVRKPRGFAAMDPARVAEIARKGGKAAHRAGTAHRFSADEARDAGKKGGLAPHRTRGRSA